ncbi:hypothetical protein [Citreimonas salinaria]|uniref:STAS domain-containing protein n=1 Tax=Citreimonas salinaria TaxID=321339 RepID=A0A1H3MSB4_9RHOB|nr:hypothetical protein [Citreimonas salinaria]SDY79338.1 hypothetical protein SAMN05444340_11841 [Citreimonas salinaria]
MTTEPTLHRITFNVPASLDPTTVGAVHADLVQTLHAVGAGTVRVTLDGEGPLSPLTLQLLVSARKTRSAAAVSFCGRAQVELAEIASEKGVLT